MNRTAIRPTGVERTFGPDELIVSKTDLRGRITYANDVFMRVSRYEEHELIGMPHNIVRHPDTPRALFGYVWKTVQSGEEVFAYIPNLASDGAHYWVLAHITPSTDGHGEVVGYHSNRRVPSARAVAEAQSFYADVLAAERAQDDPVTSIDAGTETFNRKLGAQGMTYDEWFWDLTTRSTQAG